MQQPAFLKKLFPFKSHYKKIAGHNMHYIDVGQGPVVLLLHGNPTWCFYYRHLIDSLRDRFRVIAPDFIGCGLSDHPTDAHFRAIHRIEHMMEFVDSLGLEKYSLVMHDWGGSIGTGLAVRRPEAIEKITYLNTTLTETESLPKMIKVAAKPFIGKYLTKGSPRFVKLTIKPKVGVTRKLAKDVQKAYLFPYKTSARRTAIWDFVEDIPFDSSHPSYSDMLFLAENIPNLAHVPVQIVWGLKDPCFHREMLNKVAKHFPQANILEIPDASHLVLEDAPELANATIRSFLLGESRTLKSGDQKVVQNSRIPRELKEGEKQSALYNSVQKQALENPDNLASIVPSFMGESVSYSQINYGEFYGLINKYQRGLSKLGLERKDRVLMLVSPGIDFLALSLAVMGRGAIPFYLDPGMGKEKLIDCIKEINPDVFIGSPKAQLLRLLKRKAFSHLRFHVVVSNWVFLGGTNLSFLKKFASKPLPAVPSTGTNLVAYTSGATGRPKGVVYSDEMIEDQLRIFKDEFGMEAGKKDLPLLPMFSLFNLALGVCSVFPPIDPSKPLALEPQKVLRVIDDMRVDYSFGSPTLWTKIGEYCVRSRKKLSSLKKIFIAGAPVPLTTLERLKEVMPEGESYTPYGATEALPVTFVSASGILSKTLEKAETGEQGTYVGGVVKGVELKICKPESLDAQDSQIVECKNNEIGEIIVSGGNISSEYFELPEQTAKSKLKIDNKIWHRMGDMAYLDQSGALYFCGRKAHSISLENKIYYSVPVERVFNEHQKVYRSALIALDKNQVGIAVEPLPQHMPVSSADKKTFIEELLEIGSKDSITSEIQKVFFFESFPVDARHNAKIFRDQLGALAKQNKSFQSAA